MYINAKLFVQTHIYYLSQTISYYQFNFDEEKMNLINYFGIKMITFFLDSHFCHNFTDKCSKQINTILLIIYYFI